MEPFGAAAAAVTLIGLTIAAYTDIKERIVNDLIPISFLVIGIGLAAAQSLMKNDYSIVGTAIAVVIGTFIGGYILWRIGFWAGGDVKLFAGIAALNPYNWSGVAGFFSAAPFFSNLSAPIFPLSLLVFSALAMLPVGLVLAIIRLRQKPAVKEKIVSEIKKKIPGIILFGLWITGISAAAGILGQSEWLAPIGALLFWVVLQILRIPKKIQWVLCGIVFLAAAWTAGYSAIIQLIEFLIVLAAAALIWTLITNAKHVFRSEKKIADLSEGDIVAITLTEQNGQIAEKTAKPWQIIKNRKNQEIAEPAGREICSAWQANGLEQNQIKELQRLMLQKKIGETIMVKESTAFVPAIWAAYIFLQAVGDPLSLVRL